MEKIKKKSLNRETAGITEKLPIKVIQYGEGNFLRAFVDYVIDKLNKKADFNAGVAVIQPLAVGMVDVLNEQDGLYNLFMKGIKKGKEIQEQETISCIQKGINPYEDYQVYLDLAKEEQLEFLISNTTEAGIAFDENDTLEGYPHSSFPAKVTALLYKRFQHFNGAKDKGLSIIPCELINYNADALKEMILKYASLWKLEDKFISWIKDHNDFHNTLVDRIVPGYPKDDIDAYQEKLEQEDKLIVSAEVFLLWVIEGDEKLKSKIPFDKIDENILIVDDLQPYRTRKVRILNGAHTTMVPFSILYGNETVKETVDHEFTGKFISEAVFEEINPTLELSEEELNSFAEEVFDRFRNPFIKHQLSSIALNSISKFKVRVLPSLLTFQEKYNRLPLRLTFAFACLIRFYKGEWNGEILPVKDDEKTTSELKQAWELNSYNEIAERVLKNGNFWDRDLTEVPQLKEKVASALELIDHKGIEEGFKIFSERSE
ncbi:tagaturonate reductase [Autumnicola psychrophila]|uniref:Tagaturonate reductase n=1 Tax=Autumnicola psychrophila TaxID=3075592 RepID=A0ABU3DUQ3_9FLAO|nr:tagaturonate reductase [Zunongwangia sp. F225]MDT0687194.1 tagaturonate reductase [Zunongwangia sp. F225]